MAKFKIQAYNREMTELIFEEDQEYREFSDALLEACSKAYEDRIIVLMIRSKEIPSRFRLIAKFY